MHDVIIQLGFALAVESEATDFAFDFPLLGFVTIILGTARHEFFDVIVGLQFAGKLSEVIPQERAGLVRFLQVNDESVSKYNTRSPKSWMALLRRSRAQEVVKEAAKMLRLGDTGMSSS